jgi:hypothetical protein
LDDLPEVVLSIVGFELFIGLDVLRHQAVFGPAYDGILQQKRLRGVVDELFSLRQLKEVVDVFVLHILKRGLIVDSFHVIVCLELHLDNVGLNVGAIGLR